MIGEGVNDYGGPYRAVFEALVAELQRDDGLLPLFVPTANRAHRVPGSDVDRWALNKALTTRSELGLVRFFGALLGAAVRAGLNLGFALERSIWESLVVVHRGRSSAKERAVAPHAADSESNSPAPAGRSLATQLGDVSLRCAPRVAPPARIAGHDVYSPLPPRGWQLGSTDARAAAHLKRIVDDPACVFFWLCICRYVCISVRVHVHARLR